MTAPLHVFAGSLGLAAGAVALFAVKGARLHRSSGFVAACSLLTMSVTGVWLAVSRRVEANALGGVLTAYLVFTALRTVNQREAKPRWPDHAAMVAALGFGLACFVIGLASAADGKAQRNGVPVPLFLVFGGVALLAGLSDWRWIRPAAIPDARRRRTVRHLWRMCLGLFIASASFFLGPDSRVPESFRIPAVRVALAILPLGVMAHSLARARVEILRDHAKLSAPREPSHFQQLP